MEMMSALSCAILLAVTEACPPKPLTSVAGSKKKPG